MYLGIILPYQNYKKKHVFNVIGGGRDKWERLYNGISKKRMNHMGNFYEIFGGRFYEYSWGSLWFPQKHRRLVALVNSRRTNLDILDVGCGTGRLLARLKGKFPMAKIYAIDLSKNMINVAKDKFGGIDAMVGNAENLPWKNNSFDIVTNSISFHHYGNPGKALSEVYRVLKHNGKFLLMDINPASNKTRYFFNLIAKYIIRDDHKSFYRKNEIHKMFQRVGFTKIKQV